MDLVAILSTLPVLSKKERVMLRGALDLLDVPPPDDHTDTTSPLYEAMSSLIGVSLTYRDFHNTVAYKAWHKHAPACVAFIEKTFPETVNSKVVKLAMMTFLLEALRDDLKGRNVPVTLGTMSTNISRLPEVFEVAFPDYVKSGLTGFIVTAMTGAQK